MGRKTYALVAAVMAIGLVASGCGNSHDSAAKTTAPTAAQLQSLIPTPANTQRTDGPTSIPDNGIHMHFLVNGPGADVLNAYKTVLEAKGWAVTVVASGGWGATGGATYTATHGRHLRRVQRRRQRRHHRRRCLRMAVKAREPQLWRRQPPIAATIRG